MTTPAFTPLAAIRDRLTEIYNMKKGWLDGAGETIDYPVIHTANALIKALPATLHPLSIYPTEPGGIEIEWRDQHGTHSITVNPDQTLFLLSDDPADAPAPAAGLEAPHA